jgi:cytochrome b
MSVHREINHHVVQTIAEARLLYGQIIAQSMAVRMAFARRMVAMPIRRRVVVMIATRIRFERSHGPGTAIFVVHIVPATSKHCMDEQRSTQQAGKNGPHCSVNRNRL